MTGLARSKGGGPRLLDPGVLAGLSNLELVARAVVEGMLIGLHRSPRFGFSQEFAEYRPYSEGDDLRFIDWNVYARTDRTYIKRFQGETNSHLVVLLDSSASMGFGTGSVTKLRYAQFLAASLAWLAARQRDAVGTLIFDDDVRDYLAPSGRTGKLASVLHAIDAAEAGRGTRLDKPFEKFRQHVQKRGMVAVISDFYCDAEEMIQGVRPLAFQGQDVMLFHVLDSAELKPEISEPTLLEDLESGQAIEVTPQFMQREYPTKIQAHIQSINEAASSIGADYQLLNTSEPLDQALRKYLAFRERRS